jgi:hypothetical protein
VDGLVPEEDDNDVEKVLCHPSDQDSYADRFVVFGGVLFDFGQPEAVGF